MLLIRRSPLDKAFVDLRSEMDRLMGGLFRPDECLGDPFALPLDLSEDSENVYVRMEIPGVEPGDFDLSYQDGTLTIRGEKKEESEKKDRNFHRVERRFGQFSRSVFIPSVVDAEKIAADFDKGLLTVTLPKRQEAKPKTIVVKPKGA